MSAEKVIAEALKWSNGNDGLDDWSVEAADAVAALKAAGYAVVQLPKPPPPRSDRWVDAEGNPDWDAHADELRQGLLDKLADEYWITLGSDGIHFTNSPEGCTPDQAREFAAALLAAAAEAANA